jgi:hypothetical protein
VHLHHPQIPDLQIESDRPPSRIWDILNSRPYTAQDKQVVHNMGMRIMSFDESSLFKPISITVIRFEHRSGHARRCLNGKSVAVGIIKKLIPV